MRGKPAIAVAEPGALGDERQTLAALRRRGMKSPLALREGSFWILRRGRDLEVSTRTEVPPTLVVELVYTHDGAYWLTIGADGDLRPRTVLPSGEAGEVNAQAPRRT